MSRINLKKLITHAMPRPNAAHCTHHSPGEVITLITKSINTMIYSVSGGFQPSLFLPLILLVFSLMLADFFDTMGTLVGVGSEAGYLNERGELPDAQKPLLVDSLAFLVEISPSRASSGAGRYSRCGYRWTRRIFAVIVRPDA